MNKLFFITFFTVCLQASAGYTAEQPIVRASFSPEEVVVGGEVTLTITVLVPTWFSKPIAYPSMEMEGVVTVLPPDSTYSMNEKRAGSTWSGITREYKLYPLESGKFDFRKKQIEVAYADPQTRKPIPNKLFLPELQFSAIVPAGAENLNPFLAGSSLELIQELSQEADIYRPGDAVERRITARLKGMQSMFIPPLLSTHEEPGLSIYPGTSRTDDEYAENREAVTGVRSEAVTYVFERGGTYELPPVTLRWWNAATKQVEKAEISSIVLRVEKSFAQQIKDLPLTIVFTIILIVLGLTLFILYFRKAVFGALVSSWTGFCRSEPYVFLGTILRVLFRDSRTAYLGILAWQRRISPDSGHIPGSTGRSSIRALEASIYGPDSRKISFGIALRGKVVSELLTLRSSIRAKERLRDSGVGSLNPF
jgi:hypothetical protein